MAAYTFNNPAPPPVSPYLGPHEIYPNTFPAYPYHQHPQQPPLPPAQPQMRPTYAYSYQHAQHREMNYLPKTLPMEDPDSLSLLDSKSLEEQHRLIPEPFEVWNNNNVHLAMKSVPKFDSLLDIDRLEQLCYDEVDMTRKGLQNSEKTAISRPPRKEKVAAHVPVKNPQQEKTNNSRPSIVGTTTSSSTPIQMLNGSSHHTTAGARPKEPVPAPSKETTAKTMASDSPKVV